MGGTNSGLNKEAVIAESPIPPYSVKCIGSRHFIVAGGGGAVKTGVKNEIDLYLLSYNSNIPFLEAAQQALPLSDITKLRAIQTGLISTSIYANMNVDVIPLDQPEAGKYLIASGQDMYCSLYQTNGFSLTNSHEEEGTSSKLSLDISRLCRIETVTNSKNDDPYQKCVRLYTLGKHLYMATGGSDGFVRIWNLSEMITGDLISSNQKLDEDVPPTDIGGEPTFEIQTEGEIVDELDVSKCGSVLSVVLDKKTVFYDTENGHQLLQLDIPQELGKDYKIRSLKFLPLDKSGKNAIFAAGYNQIMRSSKNNSYLSLWAYSKNEVRSHIISLARACDEPISCLSASECGNFLAIGTMNGSVAIFDTHNLKKPLRMVKESHSLFVTGLEFLPQRSYDCKDWGRIISGVANDSNAKETATKCFLPGVCANYKASVLSLGVDQTIQLHSVEYPISSTATGYLLKLALASLLLYLILWFLFLY